MRNRPLLRTIVAGAAAALALAGCAGGSQSGAQSDAGQSGSAAGQSGQSGATDAFPVTLHSALGDATIASEPKRVVTWGWGSTDAALALGVVPVAIPAQTYGGDAKGVLPWIQDKLDQLGAATPTILPSDSTEAPVEAIVAADPDVILAPYSGLTQQEFDQLSAIAPVVAYPDKAWSTPWRDVITITGTALGRSAQAAQVIAGIDARITAAAAAHPEFSGVSIAQVWNTNDTFYVYLPTDPRVEFLEDLGFTTAPSVKTLDTGEATFYYSLSYEKLDQLTSDMLVVYGDTDDDIDTFLASDHAKLLSQVGAGHVARIVGPAQIAAVSPPTALSLTWGIDDTVKALAAGVATLK